MKKVKVQCKEATSRRYCEGYREVILCGASLGKAAILWLWERIMLSASGGAFPTADLDRESIEVWVMIICRWQGCAAIAIVRPYKTFPPNFLLRCASVR